MIKIKNNNNYYKMLLIYINKDKIIIKIII